MVASRDTFIVLTTLLSILLLGTPVHTVSSKEITSHTYSEHTAIAVASPITHLIAPRSRVRNFTGCEQYRSLIQENFPPNAVETFLKIMKAESGCNKRAIGDGHITFLSRNVQYGMSCGLFQIRSLPGRPSCESMQDPEQSAQFAANLYMKSGYRPWSVCKNGKVNCN